jgi:hypothetical protein
MQNLTYTVKSNTEKNERVQLLNSMSGCFLPGEMSALVRPSKPSQADPSCLDRSHAFQLFARCSRKERLLMISYFKWPELL